MATYALYFCTDAYYERWLPWKLFGTTMSADSEFSTSEVSTSMAYLSLASACSVVSSCFAFLFSFLRLESSPSSLSLLLPLSLPLLLLELLLPCLRFLCLSTALSLPLALSLSFALSADLDLERFLPVSGDLRETLFLSRDNDLLRSLDNDLFRSLEADRLLSCLRSLLSGFESLLDLSSLLEGLSTLPVLLLYLSVCLLPRSLSTFLSRRSLLATSTVEF